ncbi:DUF192 domain-containing protein [Ferroacidibacillus organovorans]|nr:DUF192 domain-containing protein [Ferroacidibacillus organovorans]
MYKDDLLFAHDIQVARTFFQRLRGLTGVRRLSAHAGMYFDHCNAVHTFFMKMPIDVLFLNRNNEVIKIVECVSPRKFCYCKGAVKTLELQGGAVRRMGIECSDHLQFVDPCVRTPIARELSFR